MTTKIAVELRFSLRVACDAEIHLEIHSAQPVHRRNVSVTSQTVNLCHYVRTVPELYKIGNKVDSHPGDWDFFDQIILLFLNLGMHRNYVFMAKETLLDFRQPRVFRALYVRMAETAIDLFDPGMNTVAEKDGLDRSNVLSREQVKEVDKGEQK
jgi:hypothetical protein